MTMLFASVMRDALEMVPQSCSGAVELRLEGGSVGGVADFLKRATFPVMLTARGGEGEARIEELLRLKPLFFDLEWDVREAFLRKVVAQYPETKLVLSYHNFESAPDDLERVLAAMQKVPAFHYKIAVMVRSASEALRLLVFGKRHPEVSVIPMGERGAFGRVLGPVVGNQLNYARLEGAAGTAPGQLTVRELEEVYRFGALNRETAIYGLIGDPVEPSVGHRHHNGVFRKRGVNAVYVKMAVQPDELVEFMPLAQAIGIRGLSVTMPLKEKVLPFVDRLDPTAQQIGAVNTLLFEGGEVRGANTDGVGALDAIEVKGAVRGKRMVVIGAGGAARAIAFEALQRGAEVTILNRTVERGEALAARWGCKAGGLADVPSDVEILVNGSPDPLPIDPTILRAGMVVMDVVYVPRETALLKEARERGCQVVYGEEMFVRQAAGQTALWLGL